MLEAERAEVIRFTHPFPPIRGHLHIEGVPIVKAEAQVLVFWGFQ